MGWATEEQRRSWCKTLISFSRRQSRRWLHKPKLPHPELLTFVIGRAPLGFPSTATMQSTTLTKRVRILTTEDVEEHASPKSCWVTRDGKVYDVTKFLPDHPGGDDLILKYAGKDVGEIMMDSTEHDHSDSAYNMLSEFLIGRLGANAGIVDENWVPSEDFKPDETDISTDYEKNRFLDLGKPLLSQFLYANFSKSYYLQQIHQPRHVVQSARLFGPDYLEVHLLWDRNLRRMY